MWLFPQHLPGSSNGVGWGWGPLFPKVNVKILANFNFLVKTKYVPKVLKCKINPTFFFEFKGFPTVGGGGPPFGKNSQIIP